MATTLTVNGESRTIDMPEETPLLWAIREGLNLTGTKYGCGVAACGACTVHLDGTAVRSCQIALGDVAGASVVTIEGLGTPDAPTTVSAGVILVEEGVVAHGTVWARQAGVVWGTT